MDRDNKDALIIIVTVVLLFMGSIGLFIRIDQLHTEAMVEQGLVKCEGWRAIKE